MKILNVEHNSIAWELGIKGGDELIAFDGNAVVDALDYEYYLSMENFIMTVKQGGEIVEYEIEKYGDEELGLELDREISVKRCRNNCIFCFVAQLPKEEKLRKTLLVKDDDYRHSFISGNYVTLTNLSESDMQRILRLRLSPIYVSVHSTNDDTRRKLLGNPKAPSIMDQLRRLKSGGITIHTQIVYCPDYNEDYKQSVIDLAQVSDSCALVPVGLTKGHNPILRPVNKADAEAVVRAVEELQEINYKEKGTRFVFAADEFYIKAQVAIPPYETYEDFSQIENGIGLVAAFKHDFLFALERAKKSGKQFNIGKMSMATGVSAYELIREHAKILTDTFGGEIHVYCVNNEFFGNTVTVAGLVVGRDLVRSLQGKDLGERLMLPKTMFKEFKDVFLDNMSVTEVEQALNVRVIIAPPDGEGFVKSVLNIREEL